MSYEYSEDKLIQQTASDGLGDLGWECVYAFDSERLGDGEDSTFGRRDYHEVILDKYFIPAVRRLNPWIDDRQISEVKKALTAHMSISTLMQINEAKYFLLRDGVYVDAVQNGRKVKKRVRLIDFDEADNNSFLAVREFKVEGSVYRRRADIVGFVNGLPLMFIELKKPSVDVRAAYDGNYTDYQQSVPQLFYYNAFSILSNGLDAKIGTIGSKYEFFGEWKRLAESDEGRVSLDVMLRGVCTKENLLDLLENFILYDRSGGRTVKILARNHQYLGVNEALESYKNRKLNKGKMGVFWHTQGSGKSYSMVFLAKKIRRKCDGLPTIVVLTDREELNRQISDTFQNCGLLDGLSAGAYMAASGADLLNKLQGNPGFIFTLIQKFNFDNVPPIRPKHDIIIMSDEAHRSQYGIFAENMCRLLPTASRIGFTGTPLLSDDNITERTFGSYVSIYDFKRAVEDKATVPLYYENRGDKILHIENPAINDRMLEAIEAAEADEDERKRLEREFKKEIHLLTTENRLRSIAEDFVQHYSDLWTSGKAMFVCLNKVTCVRMYNYVQEYWQKETTKLENKMMCVDQQEAQELSHKLKWMRETKMAVVVSQEQNEQQTFDKWGLDIRPHRLKMEREDLAKEFKDAENPFRVVFVCAMWLTGFDVKCLSCLYLDKPLKAHTLMQTIARANRVAEGKSNGLIVDYVGIIKALRKALADYTANISGSGADPTIDKDELIAKLYECISSIDELLAKHDLKLDMLSEAEGFDKLNLLRKAADELSSDKTVQKSFKAYAAQLKKIMKYIDRDDIDDNTRSIVNAAAAIYDVLTKKRNHAPNVDLTVTINGILNDYVRVEKHISKEKSFDISLIDFYKLSSEFKRTQNKHLLLRDIKEAVEQQLKKMMAVNPRRVNFYEHYQEIIDAYNRAQDKASIEQTFMELMKMAQQMTDEQQRYIREGLSSESELALFDIMMKKDLSDDDKKQLKQASHELMKAIKTVQQKTDSWKDKEVGTSQMKVAIRNVLWNNLPQSYSDDEIAVYENRVFTYVYAR